jgi:hypothetical protein
MIFSFPR